MCVCVCVCVCCCCVCVLLLCVCSSKSCYSKPNFKLTLPCAKGAGKARLISKDIVTTPVYFQFL